VQECVSSKTFNGCYFVFIEILHAVIKMLAGKDEMRGGKIEKRG